MDSQTVQHALTRLSTQGEGLPLSGSLRAPRSTGASGCACQPATTGWLRLNGHVMKGVLR